MQLNIQVVTDNAKEEQLLEALLHAADVSYGFEDGDIPLQVVYTIYPGDIDNSAVYIVNKIRELQNAA